MDEKAAEEQQGMSGPSPRDGNTRFLDVLRPIEKEEERQRQLELREERARLALIEARRKKERAERRARIAKLRQTVCRSQTWVGKGHMHTYQVGIGRVGVAAAYTCKGQPNLKAYVEARGTALGFAAQLHKAHWVDLRTIKGVKRMDGLKGEFAVRGQNFFCVSAAAAPYASGSIRLSQDDVFRGKASAAAQLNVFGIGGEVGVKEGQGFFGGWVSGGTEGLRLEALNNFDAKIVSVRPILPILGGR